MGAWDTGNFVNDAAMDWIGDLRESGTPDTVLTTLRQVTKQGIPAQPSFVGKLLGRRPARAYLEAPVASEGLAAAEIVACWLGHPSPKLPEGIMEWIRQNSGAFTPDLAQTARQAVTAIKTKSELKDLWEEGDAATAAEWHAVISDLERRLQS